MNPEEIFHKAIEIADPVQRAAYLDDACKEDQKLRAEIEALLQAHAAAGDFLEMPALDRGATLDKPPQIEGPGTRIGHYELLELIGEGGMGLVYLAEQKEPVKRRVAFKIIKPGMDSKQVIARFEAERQALALLDHPNIAHIFDADTTETGRPYFVMEYVKGMSITRYCDERKLNIEQRLRLFEQVCEAVHHAHQKGIIHRDIKPSNILVSVHGDRAVPKIIDFGIAKAITQPLTDKTFVTFQGQLLGTPEYMSPEQVDLATQDIDTRSDIYSLGVVLYELLAGVLPFERESFERAGFAEIQQMVREQEPASPSIRLTHLGEKAKTIAASRGTQVIALARRLHRELEWIPLKAMRKDRCRRYKSASELADDIRNYLDGNPLIAGPETAIYRMQKFVRRHAGSVATVALVALAILLGLVVSTAMYFRAESMRVQAEQARENETVARTRAEQAEETTKSKAEELRRTLYVNSIQLADAKYREGNAKQVRSLLDSCPNDLRGWEWERLNYMSDRSLMTISGHQDIIYSIALSPDGKRIVSGGSDGTIKVWNVVSGAELMTLRGHSEAVYSLAFSPDGKRIISGSEDKTIKIWDLENGTELMTLHGHEGTVSCVTFNPGGKRIVSSDYMKGTIKVWDAQTGQELMTFSGAHEGGASDVAVSPDNKRIVSCGFWEDKKIKIWDAATGEGVMTLSDVHKDIVSGVIFSPDGKQIVSVGGWDGAIKFWDAKTGAMMMTTRGHGAYVISITFSPDGGCIASAGNDNMIKVWSSATGEELMTLRGHESTVMSIAFSPDGRRIASGSWDNTIKVWDVSLDHETARLVGHRRVVSSIAFSLDGKHILTGSWDGTAKIWNVQTSSETMTLAGQEGVAITGDAVGVEYSPDGKRVASVFHSGTVKVWDVTTGRVLMALCRGQCQQQQGLAFSPDGNYLAAGGKVWNAQNGTEVMTLHSAEERVRCVTFSPDGKSIASGDHNGTLKVWDVGTGKQLLTLHGHEGRIMQIAFSPDGNQMISGGDDTTIKIWDTKTGAEMMTLRGHADIVVSVKFSPDGKRVISGSRDGTAKMWDAATGAELLTLRAYAGAFSVVFSPDGKTLAAGTVDGTVLLWESAPPPAGYERRKNGETARKTVDELYEKHNYYYDVIDKLNTDKTLDEPVRKLAIQIANSRKWEDADKLENEAWETVSSPDKDISAYQMAFEKSKKAAAWEPNDPAILTTLGAAQYRVGSYEDALNTLTKADKIRTSTDEEPDPTNVAFTAMTLHKLGRPEDAQAALEQLRELCKDKQYTEDVEVQDLLAEAEKLLSGEEQKK